MDSTKAFQKDNIPPKILKANVDVCKSFLCYDIDKCIDDGSFPTCPKRADITPIFKKDNPQAKEIYRPVSILPALSKVYENILHNQINDYFNDIFSKYLCGFRKGHSTQHCLLCMLEN